MKPLSLRHSTLMALLLVALTAGIFGCAETDVPDAAPINNPDNNSDGDNNQDPNNNDPDNNGETPDNNGETPDNNGETPDNNGETPDNNGETPDNNSAPDDNQVGEACDTDDNCETGLCISITDGRKICTEYCASADDCPGGYACLFVENSGPDGVFICSPDDTSLCRSCEQDAECGGLSDLCVEYAEGQNFCSRSCANNDCPDGYTCQEIDLDGGDVAYQCLKDEGFCCDITNDGEEICDLIDNDCDGDIDEDFNLDDDLNNCGACGVSCNLNNATAVCSTGVCEIASCLSGFFDLDGNPNNGCEYSCVPRGAEVCNGQDDDCDGLIDEDFDLTSDANNCNTCGNVCSVQNGTGQCLASECALDTCNTGFADCDENQLICETNVQFDPMNCGACDYQCDRDWSGSANAVTQCINSQCQRAACQQGFADCNMLQEDGCEINLATSVDHCLFCGNSCDLPNAVSECTPSGCRFVACDEGYFDNDNNPDNGCEYGCAFDPPMATDDPDNEFVDANCDGVDGDISKAIFVRSDGNDVADGLTPAGAVASLGKAIEIANARTERTQILIATGNYTATEAVTLRSGVSVYGGYSATFTSRSNARSTLTTNGETVLIAQNLSAPILLDRLNIITTDRNGQSLASIAVKADNAGNYFTIQNSAISAGRGGNGANGEAGANGTNGSNGANGNGHRGGNGGNIGGGKGGDGQDGDRGNAGANGNVVGPNCGRGGARLSEGEANTGCFGDDPGHGKPGQIGCAGTNGNHGSSGSDTGNLQGISWVPTHGTNGTVGTNGNGGGAGGSGAGEYCGLTSYEGRGGGGGGGGGTAGQAGQGGQSGGASIGLLVRGSTVTLSDTNISTSGGGTGGRGGNGGAGGSGGDGGRGALSNDTEDEGHGGDGGDGGNGGNGGCGGGGAGGPSVGVWGNGNAALVIQGDSEVNSGPAGTGGLSCGNAGPNGVRETFRNVTRQ